MKRRAKCEDHSYWKSYSDMMAALLLVFVLIMTVALYKTSEQAIKLQEQEKQLHNLLGIKPQIVQELREELEEFEVSIDEKTGDIKFKSDILFNYNEAGLKPEGIDFLDKFMPKYLSVVFDDNYIPYVAEIIIEGHTDTQGGYMYNLKLSQERALSVAEFCISDNNTVLSDAQLAKLRQIITVNGKSFSNPVYENGTVNAELSRRVEVKFRLKDDETIEALQAILDGE